MLYFIDQFLGKNKCQDLKKRLMMNSDWIDGATSAQGHTKQLKRNLQLNPGEAYGKFSEEIIIALQNNNLIQNFAFPSKIFNLLFTRTGVGMYYQPHVDLAYIDFKRRDMSFTIFLSEPDEYKGGELLLNVPPEKKSVKLQAGQIIIYPTKYIHEVKEVTEGERMVCVGWIESQIPRDDDREMLSMLKGSINQVTNNPGDLSSRINLNAAFNNIHRRFMS